ncbi:MAG: Hsp20/alpha crystallin family protein [Bacteroidota bacterium]
MCYKTGYHHKWGYHPKYHYGTHPRKYKRRKFRAGWGFPPVNVQELDESYELFLYAPGLGKEDFNIRLRDNILIIEVDKKDDGKGNGPIWLRKEFSPSGFKRRFELNESIDPEKITAKYEDGMLQVSLPKKPDFHTSRKDITVE